MSDAENAEFISSVAPATPSLAQQLLKYRRPIGTRALFELSLTVGLLALGWLLMWLSLSLSYWLTLLIALPTAGFLVRLFMIQHDCGHGAFFRNRRLNDWIGRTLGVFTFTPYDYWKRNHALHHASAGNLDRRGAGDILILTVQEYLSRSTRPHCLPRLSKSDHHVRYRTRLSVFVGASCSHRTDAIGLAGMGQFARDKCRNHRFRCGNDLASWLRTIRGGAVARCTARFVHRCMAILCAASIRPRRLVSR